MIFDGYKVYITDLKKYINLNYRDIFDGIRSDIPMAFDDFGSDDKYYEDQNSFRLLEESKYASQDSSSASNLANILEAIKEIASKRDDSFGSMLIKKIDEKGMTDAACYKKALINKSLFNKIKNNPNYNVQKDTVFALSLALKLNIEEASELLEKAGYAFSGSSEKDLIVKFCIERKIYDLFIVNGLLNEFGQKLLGSGVRDN